MVSVDDWIIQLLQRCKIPLEYVLKNWEHEPGAKQVVPTRLHEEVSPPNPESLKLDMVVMKQRCLKHETETGVCLNLSQSGMYGYKRRTIRSGSVGPVL
jgi:hypothetical protein